MKMNLRKKFQLPKLAEGGGKYFILGSAITGIGICIIGVAMMCLGVAEVHVIPRLMFAIGIGFIGIGVMAAGSYALAAAFVPNYTE